MTLINESDGKRLFGHNSAGYDAIRPPYPGWIFSLLKEQNALYSGARTLEIGAGNGLASRELIKAGVSPLTLLEPDERFAPLLGALAENTPNNVAIRHESFEEASFETPFDLVVIATAFHWLAPETRVKKLAQIVKPKGYVALLWNVFADPSRPDPFHEATYSLLSSLEISPSDRPAQKPFALDKEAREREFLQDGDFELVIYAESHWPFHLSSEGVRKLYGTFSNLSRLSAVKKEATLDKLVHIAETQFSGRVTRNMTTPLYLFRRS